MPIHTEPGKPIEEVARELGFDPSNIAKLASNESPFGSSPKAVEAVRAWAENAWLYPDGSCYDLKARLAAEREVGPEQLILGNGCTGLEYQVPRLLGAMPDKGETSPWYQRVPTTFAAAP